MARKMKMAFVAIMHRPLPRWLRLLILIGCFCMVGACLALYTLVR